MKCPKCGYLGYERVERCRNCGYEFLLGSSSQTPDLRLRESGNVPHPLDDLDLIDAATPLPSVDRFNEIVPETLPASQNGLAELPLFGAPITDDVPLITKASPPRPPLSVRRATPDLPRLRSEPRAAKLEWPDPTPSSPLYKEALERQSKPVPGSATARRRVNERESAEPAGFVARALATVIDVSLLALVDLVVVYFTLKICRLTTAEVTMLPKAPLMAFLLMQNLGYFVAFTTTGQTLGKMITGVRVTSDDSDSAPDVGRSVLRALLWAVLALPVGLGLLTAALSRDGRGLHDRFAGTRVVRAGA